MMSCWNIDSTKRPTFEALEVTLSAILEADAVYMELSSGQKEKNTSESEHYTPLITTGINRVVKEAQRDERYIRLHGPKKEMYEEMETPMMNMYEDVEEMESPMMNMYEDVGEMESPVMKDEDVGNPVSQKENVDRHD